MSPRKATPKVPAERAVLVFVGRQGRRFRGIPTRDLDEHDLNRIAYRRALSVTGTSGVRPDPRDPDPTVINEIMAELTGSGLYVAEEAQDG